MKLYISIGPNPRVVRMFLAEKGIVIPEHMIDLVGGENRRPAFLALNPVGQLPVLERDNGQPLGEITAICEYLEEVLEGPALIGSNADERAEVRMWVRRIDNAFCQPLTAAFRYGPGLGMFRDRVHCIPHAAADMAEITEEGAVWINAQMGARTYLAGDRLSLADIMLFCFLDFGVHRANFQISPKWQNLANWYDRMSLRPSAEASRRLPQQVLT